MTLNRSKNRVMLAALLGVAFLGITLHAAINQPIATGTLPNWEPFGGPATIHMRTLTIAPGEVLGWHYHPGIGALTVVTQGNLVVEDGCGGEQLYEQGDAFLEPPGRVHRGKNLTTGAVVTAQTFIVPAGSPTSVSTPQLCGAPATVGECRDDRWMTFNHPRTFINQGDCQQFVLTGK